MKLFEWLNEEEDGEPPSSPRLLDKLKDLHPMPVKRIMVPRALIVALDADVHPRRVRRLKSLKATYLAVYRGDLDHILGWVPKARVLDLIQDPNAEVELSEYAQSVGFIDEDMPVSAVADAFLKFKCPFLVARNGSGQTTGLVTLADYVEAVFGFPMGETTPTPAPTVTPLRDYEL
jgi:Mg2+/Co2+ transporter CorB